MDIDLIVMRQKSLENELRKLKKEFNKSPDGTLIVYTVGGKHRWYWQKKKADGGFSRTYISADNINQARLLARKAYIRNKIIDMENELKSIKRYLNVRKKTAYDLLIKKDSPYWELLTGNRWDLEPYERNKSYPEKLIVKAPKGEYVRSKSEAMIANALYERGIQYRYECALYLYSYPFYPDFTIRKTSNGKIFLWEHFGRVDDPEYYSKMTKKLRAYINNGYFPGVNLLMTFESKNNPLTIEEVNRIINHYLT